MPYYIIKRLVNIKNNNQVDYFTYKATLGQGFWGNDIESAFRFSSIETIRELRYSHPKLKDEFHILEIMTII